MKKVLLLVALVFCSCQDIDCEYWEKQARDGQCIIILDYLPTYSTPRLNAHGKNLYTKKDCVCSDGTRWWTQYDKYLEKGDTIIKRKGELVFSIHKKDTVLNFNWICNGKAYR